MGWSQPMRAAQATAVAAVGVPCMLLAHLLTTGAPATRPADVLAALAVLTVGALVPARSVTGLALLTALGQVAGHAVLASLTPASSGSPACIPAVGRGASLGLHLTVLRPDAACPAGTLAPGPAASAVIAAVGVAVVILAGHATAAVLSGFVVAATRSAARLIASLGETLAAALATIAALPGRLRTLVRWARRAVSGGALRISAADDAGRLALTPQWRPGAVALRGPPLGRCAAPA